MDRPNVLFVSLDTVRADVAYSGRLPGVERLRGDGVTFRQAISSSPLTPISHATVFTGLQPPRHGIRHLLREQLRPEVPTLAGKLRAAGYSTGAVVSCPGLSTWYGINRGFDFYDDEIPLLPDGRDPLTVNDVKLRGLALKRAPLVVDRAMGWLDQQPGEPFFLFAHFFDAHWPYEPPEDVGVRVDNPYEGEVAYSDHYLQRLLERLAGSGRPTLVVCFSDHGEDLGGWYPNDHAGEQRYGYEEGHGCLLFDSTQHVPLIVCGPDLPAGLEVDQQVRLVDVMPTVLELLGLEPEESDGTPLTEFFTDPEARSRPAYSETHFREELVSAEYKDLIPLASVRIDEGKEARRKVIWELGGSHVEVYDLHADPHERHGLGLIG
jgi:arylsulfatase A-like enzyme